MGFFINILTTAPRVERSNPGLFLSFIRTHQLVSLVNIRGSEAANGHKAVVIINKQWRKEAIILTLIVPNGENPILTIIRKSEIRTSNKLKICRCGSNIKKILCKRQFRYNW